MRRLRPRVSFLYTPMNNTLNEELNTEYSRIAMRVTRVCILCSVFLCLMKLAGGIIANSDALVSDGLNSAFDVVSGIIVLIGAGIAGKNPDREHPYGHERFESVATVILSVVLFVTAVFVGHTAIEDLISGSYRACEAPGKLSIIAALLSMAVKEILFRYTNAAAEKINSVALRAAARDHRTDVISTAGALTGIMVSRYGFPAGDLIASLLVCLFIVRTAYLVFREAIGQMTDRSCDDAFLQELRGCILSVNGVLGIDVLNVRAFGNRFYVDLEIREDGGVSLTEAHKVAEQVHDTIEKRYPVIKHIMIHVNPDTKPAPSGKANK